MDLVEQFETEHKGLGLRAKEFIKQGSIVIKEAPFVYAVNEGEKRLFCNNCLKKAPLKSCSRCKQAFYCSTNCQKRMWIHHKHECSTFKYTTGDPDGLTTAMVVFRALRRIKQKPSIYTEKEEGNLRSLSDLKLFEFDGLDHITDLVHSNLRVLRDNGCDLFSTEFFTSKDIRRLVGKINANFHVIADEEMSYERGCGLYLNLINHDCEPNCFPAYKTPDVHIRATRDIEPGEEITIQYCELPGCKQMKKNHLRYECKCDGCNQNKYEDEMLRGKDGTRLKQEEIDTLITEINHLTKLSLQMETSKHAEEIAKYGKALLRKQDLTHGNIFSFQIMCILIPVYFSMHKEDEALEFHRLIAPLYNKWTSVSAALGHLNFRVGMLLMLAEKYAKAKIFLSSALDILYLTHGKESGLVEQTETTLNFCKTIVKSKRRR